MMSLDLEYTKDMESARPAMFVAEADSFPEFTSSILQQINNSCSVQRIFQL